MPRERILIAVKTYPALSQKYGETVCTAGIRPDGTWMRIYPVPFRRLEDEGHYKKFDWIEADFRPATFDPRPETFHPTDFSQFVPRGHVGKNDGWRERRHYLLNQTTVYTDITTLIEKAKQNILSLAMFKPARILGFICENDDREWDPGKIEIMRQKARQGELFPEESWRQTFKLIPKLPYAFSYRFEDINGRQCTLQILDWECGQLYWNCCRQNGEDEEDAIQKVRDKYFQELTRRDLYFILGTTQQHHFTAPNPWVIIGLFYPPHQPQLELNLT
ncbi:MAG: hypothetical protein LBM04_05320 [Opitutaceae bacterium]|jgi:hypothetical protein|nr:hypothetical protein [Opitutaceae bacterium]